MKERGVFVSFGLGGHHICLKGEYNGTLSGYDSPESFEKAMQGGRYAERDLEGAPVVDIRAVVEDHPGLAYRAPLCSVNLEGNQIDRCPEPSDIMRLAMKEQGGSFNTFLQLQTLHEKTTQAQEPGPLDSVSPQRLLAYWKGHGARTGRIQNNQIMWEA
jgi:hypothetical protein